MPEVVWQQCINRLQDELPSQQFNTWIRPLQASMEGHSLTLIAPNRFIKDFVSDKFVQRISELVRELEPDSAMDVVLEIGSGSGLAGSGPAANGRNRRATDGVFQPAVSGAAVSGLSRSSTSAPVRSPSTLNESSGPAITGQANTRRVEVEGALQHQHHLVENYTFDSFGKSG